MLAHLTLAAGLGAQTAPSPNVHVWVAELNSGGFPIPGAGKVVRVNKHGDIEEVATGLVAPTGMTFGPDGVRYVSNFGDACAGSGQIVRIDIP